MTKKEREKIKEAIRLLHEDDRWQAAMEILVKLVNPGWSDPFKDTKGVSIFELLKNSEKYCKTKL
jgi:hypothetical protein